MEEISPKTYEKYIKALTDISRAITSDLYLEDILKLIVMVTAKVNRRRNLFPLAHRRQPSEQDHPA